MPRHNLRPVVMLSFETREDAEEKQEQQLFELATGVLNQLSENWRRATVLAFNWRRNRLAMRTFSREWGRNANLMARAYRWWPEEFAEDSGNSANAYQCLFAIARLPSYREAQALYNRWKDHSDWESWQVNRLVENIRIKAQKVRKSPPVRLSNTKLIGLRKVDGGTDLELFSTDRKPEELKRGGVYKVILEPEEE